VGFCEQATGQQFVEHADFESFAMRDYRRFWALLLEWCELITEGSAEPVCVGEEPETAVFFGDLGLSYVENLLHIDSDQDAERVAVIARHAGRRTQRLTRGELRDAVCRVAAHLRRLDVAPGDRVVAVANNNAELLIAALAAAAIGATFACASPDMGAAAVLGRFEQLAPVVLVANLLDTASPAPGSAAVGSPAERLREIAQALPTLRAVIVLDEAPLPVGLPVPALRLDELLRAAPVPPAADWPRFSFNHPLFVLFTSGTTGRPKCIVHGAGGTLLEHVKEHRLHLDLSAADRLFFHTSAAWMMWNWQCTALASHSTIVLYDGPVSGPDTLWDIVAQEQVTVFGTSPPYLQLCEDLGYAPARECDLTALRAVLSTGSILHDWQFDWCAEHVGPIPVQSISGGSDIIGCFVLGHPDRPVTRGWIQCRSLGLDVAALLDGRAVIGAVGELVCRRPFPSRPLRFFADGGERFHQAYFSQNAGVWTHGDLIEFDSTGQARMHGRSDGVINVRGIRIGPAEIARALAGVREVTEALAVHRNATDRGAEEIVLLVVLASGVCLTPELTARIRTEIARNATAAHVPGTVVAVSALPSTHNGKRSERAARDAVNGVEVINRAALRNPDSLEEIQRAVAQPGGGTDRPATAHEGPESDLERALVALWCRLLKVDSISVHDDFFALGGNSVLAIQLVHAISTQLEYACPLPTVFRHRSVRALAATLQTEDEQAAVATVLPLTPGSDGPEMFCVAGIHTYQALADRLAPVATMHGVFLPVEQELFAGRRRLSVDEMAASYLSAVRERQPHGPYRLLGFSFGGVLAYEMAQQLRCAGETVALLVLLDSILPEALTWSRPRWAWRRIKRASKRRREAVRRALASRGGRPLTAAQETDALEKLRLDIYHDAIRRYRRTPYPGSAVLLRCREQLAFMGDTLADSSYGWGRLVADLEVVDIPGDHLSNLQEPHVDTLASVLRARMGAELRVTSARR
jgi:acetoacetyl-CoA synthetase